MTQRILDRETILLLNIFCFSILQLVPEQWILLRLLTMILWTIGIILSIHTIFQKVKKH